MKKTVLAAAAAIVMFAAAGVAEGNALSSAQDIARLESGGELARDPAEKPVDAPKDMKLILCIGQSNMAGRAKPTDEDRSVVANAYKLNRDNKWVAAKTPYHFDRDYAAVGPVDDFVRLYLKDHPGDTVGVVPCAVGGSGLASWTPSADGRRGANLRVALERAKAAKANGTFIAILWHQGETDAAKCSAEKLAGYYPRDFKSMVEAVRREIGDVPVVAGEIGRWMRKDGDHAANINPVLNTLPQTVPGCRVVSSEGLKNQDAHHFDREGQRVLGKRYYDAFKSLAIER
ncbi:MAG: sialate O-acetylesterase [Lentisphaerae bacterium]|nr:sialate O-acetylesterase [Lentisphaerota bacterium]